MRKNKFTSMFIIIICLFILSGCSHYKWKGQSSHWSSSLTYTSENKQMNFRIKYIGNEKNISKFSYVFSGNKISASGSVDKQTTPFAVNFIGISEGYEHEGDKVKLIVKWNGMEEEIELNR
ncbi:hypothetical protein [Paenibacillus pini]